jgi:signal transduction histidine kinase
MSNVVVLWSIGSAAAMMLAVLCGLVWLMDRRERATLMLCILGIATAGSAYAELGLMHSLTPAEYGTWIRWYHLPLFPALVAQVLFVHFYLESSTRWLMWSVILARSFIFVANFALQPNYHFSSIESLRFVSLLGDQISTIGAAVPRRALQSFAVLSLVLLFAYVASAVVGCWRKGGADRRRKALAVGLADGIPMLCTILYGQLVLFGVLGGPISNIPWFLGTLLIMGYVTGRDFILSQRARLEVAELRGHVAQIERVNLLGQLASGLAHELTQPLSAVSLNLAAARRLLKQAPLDTEELSAALGDIDSDKDRALEIIDRMRRLFKQRAIELTPIKIEDLVRNAALLVGAEAKSKQVVLHWNIPPGLPLVFGDSVHLSQVLLNLLTNSIQAVQARPIGDRLIVVEAHTGPSMDEVEICVQDSGPGVPGAIVKRIFEPLYTTKPDGLGMGLSLSHSIIEAHGGRLWADNASQREGATFHFTLRRA